MTEEERLHALEALLLEPDTKLTILPDGTIEGGNFDFAENLSIAKLELGKDDILVVRVSEELCRDFEELRNIDPRVPTALKQIELFLANSPLFANGGFKFLVIDNNIELSVIKQKDAPRLPPERIIELP